jgi:hypothetical protein
MAMKLDKVVPFGRSLAEYRLMFDLSELGLNKKIIGIADGPASFNAEMKARGNPVISIDPIYQYSAKQIENQFYNIVDDIISQVKQSPNDWVWSYHQSPEHLRENRVKVLEQFIEDYETGKTEGRYLTGELPTLDCDSQQYDIALCSHFLFLYSEQFDYEFHRAAIYEMLRVAKEVRIFPLLNLDLKQSPHLQPILNELEASGYAVTIKPVEYEIQKGGNEMLQILEA